VKRLINSSSAPKTRYYLDYGPRGEYQRKMFNSRDDLEDFVSDLVIGNDSRDLMFRAYEETEIDLSPYVEVVDLDDPSLPASVVRRLSHGQVMTVDEFEAFE